jgi:hypothetical protein
MSINNAALSAFNSEMKTLSADTDGGYNSWFPDEGMYDCTINGIYLGECTAKEWIDNEPKEHDGILVKFNYTLLDDPGSPDNPRSFDGSPFILPAGGASAYSSEKAQKQLERTLKRLKGHLCVMLDMSDIPDVSAAVSEVESRLQTESILAKVKCSSYTNPTSGKTYHTEYVNSLLGV